MTIEIKANVSNLKITKEFFGEFQAVRINYKKLLKKPNRKLKSAFSTYLRSTISFAVLEILFIILYHITYNENLYFLFGVCLFAFVLQLAMYIALNKSFKQFVKSATDSTITIDDNGITLNKPDQSVTIKWDSVKFILINKRTVSVIPKTPDKMMIVCDTDVKEQFIEGINENNYPELIIDNTSLYK